MTELLLIHLISTRPEKFVFHKVHYADEPKPLNYYLMDKDRVAMLKKMYGGDDGSTKQDLMEYGGLLTNFFGREEKGKEVLEAVDDYICHRPPNHGIGGILIPAKMARLAKS